VTVFAVQQDGLPEEETRDGVRVRRTTMPRWANAIGIARAASLARYFERFSFLGSEAERYRPDVVHGHDLETMVPAGRAALRLGVPHVHDDHELGLDKLPQLTPSWLRGWKRWGMEIATRYLLKRGAALERRWLPRAAGVITVSDACGDVLRRRYGVAPVIVRNLPRADDRPPDPRLRDRTGLPAGAKVALYQGSITEACAADACITASRAFPQGWYLVFLGVTWMRSRLEQQTRVEGLTDRVRFLDPVPPDDLAGFTRAANLGLAPVRPLNPGERYGLSNKLFEYLHGGLLVITTEGATAQAAIVRQLNAGIVIPDATSDAIASAVRSIAALTESERRSRGQALRETARREWSWDAEAGKLRALYETLLARPAAAGG
jgi:glycosyltransferase involved in cell wall biosynthesis